MYLPGKEYITDEVKYLCTEGRYLLQNCMAMVESWKAGKIKGYRRETGTVIVNEHKNLMTSFGFNYSETLLAMPGRPIEVVNVTENLVEDFTLFL